MRQERKKINRRRFLKTITTAALGSTFASAQVKANPNKLSTIDPNKTEKSQQSKFPQVPRRQLGKAKVEISCLSLGGGHNFVDNQIILKAAFDRGINYWHTANNYAGGNSELGIGKFLSKNPQARKKLFLASEPPRAELVDSIADMERCLQTSLKRMNTNFLDWYGVHGLSDPAQLTDELKQWVTSAKKRKLIKLFGFSTHANMADCLTAAAKLGWIDAIMTSFNFRLMQDTKMQAAIDACHKAGIGLIAMKSLGLRVHKIEIETEEDKKLTGHFLKCGFTETQAKIKAVLADKRISSACIGMYNVTFLLENSAATLDKAKLTKSDLGAFKEYARATCRSYCTGCSQICNSTLPDTPCVSDIMRSLMYYNSYGRHDMAKELFAQIPTSVRDKLLKTDYHLAEAHCPQHMPIAKLIAEAVSKLA